MSISQDIISKVSRNKQIKFQFERRFNKLIFLYRKCWRIHHFMSLCDITPMFIIKLQIEIEVYLILTENYGIFIYYFLCEVRFAGSRLFSIVDNCKIIDASIFLWRNSRYQVGYRKKNSEDRILDLWTPYVINTGWVSSMNVINENLLYSTPGSTAMHPTSNIRKATPIGTYRPLTSFNTL